ncbi:MAG TPA: hypothetical protein VN633_02165 [Bryobacteraceae bacterium]|nr:hypothetical protein [Bryobacteraceae bacterium]
MMGRLFVSSVFLLAASAVMTAAGAGTLPPELIAQHNPGKRSELAIELAAKALNQARGYYEAGKIDEADAQLDLVEDLAKECLESARQSRKEKYWKRAELKTAALSRHIHSLIDELSYTQRDRAKLLAKQIDSIHDKLLAGVMAK